MWVTAGKFALLAFLALAMVTILIVFIRRARANGIPPSSAGVNMYGALGGAMPPTPLPDWATEDEGPDSDPRQPSSNR